MSHNPPVDRTLGSLRDHDQPEDTWTGPVSGPEADAAGQAVLDEAVDAFRQALGERLLAAYALGSLSHGGFCPLVSDVDLALILADPVQAEDRDRLVQTAERLRTGTSALHQRLSVFWGTRATLSGQEAGGRFPSLDRLCLLEHGRLLWGVDARAGLPRPGADELFLSGAEFALEFLGGVAAQIRDPELLVAQGVRWTTKVVLFPVRFLFTTETGQEGTNDEAAAAYVAQSAPGSKLVEAALGWRTEAPDHARAVAHLRDLVPLYLHYIDHHIARLEAACRPDLAGAFRVWRSRLTSGAA